MLDFEIVFIASIALSFIIVIITRVLTNPEEIRKIKKDMKFYRDKVSEAQKAGDMAKVKQFTDGMMKASQKQLGHSMKPMFVSILIFMIAIVPPSDQLGALEEIGHVPRLEIAW